MTATTLTEYRIGTIGGIPRGEGRVFLVGSRRVAVFHTRAGEVYATQAECPHRGGPLADGLMGGTTLICPLHAWAFDLATGAARTGDCALETYPVRVTESGEIVLILDETAADDARTDMAA
ncbi:MAG TPA: Rieske 2Fe-2S domain-containing protein [Roseiflexaceae bacterium]|nr:Rieske 2Fe-2S domain-containing protein [Roseiflexaceae bacterium]